MAPPGLFRRPGAPNRQLAALAMGSIAVRTEAELRAAIGRLATSATSNGTDTGVASVMGGEIIIAAPITLSVPIVIPASIDGLTIRGAGRMPIRAKGTVAAAFDIAGHRTTLRSLRFPLDTSNLFTTIVRTSATGVGISGVLSCMLDDLIAAGGALLDTSAKVANRWRVSGCEFSRFTGSAWSIDGDMGSARITTCSFAGTGGYAEGIRIVGTGTRNTIGDNTMGGGAINTGGSGGLNSLDGNTGCGTITTHVTDAPGLNT